MNLRSLQEANTTYAPNMDPDVMPDIELYTIDEEYPLPQSILSKDRQCINGGIQVAIAQTYYNCYQNSAPNSIFRVTS
jgi:hypothetical protein